MLYADSINPSRLGSSGGTVHITGSGFQPGNTVTVGGVLASVISITPTEIVAVAPSLTALGGTTTNDVKVTDLRTGGTPTIGNGLLYGSSTGDVLTVLQAPSSTSAVGAPNLFRVRLTDSNGSPVAGVTITFRVVTGSAALAPCGGSLCTVATDSTGQAQVNTTGTAAGTVGLQATTASGAQVSAQFNAVAMAQSITPVRVTEYVLASPGAVFAPAMVLIDSGSRAAGITVQWTVLSGTVSLGSTQTTSAADGKATVPAAGSLAAGSQAVVQACAWGSVCTVMNLVGVDANALRLQAVNGDSQVVNSGTRLGTMVLRVIDGAGNGIAGAIVAVRQQVTGWQPACPATGRCAVPPVYGAAISTMVSDDDGLLIVTPLQYDGTAADTRIVAATGPNGYFAVTLSKQP